ncbi:hypothetical protein AVEN_196807-1 [Araneus ventricosus]|uniref:Uncharacterized protein n=1 Tax=Araneus ventricosus TaxID=182803 RepID=A0A4Y2W082_ARAVE|nr:hypothetical protein AVEN_196807-1 [Araneus ventricosus]
MHTRFSPLYHEDAHKVEVCVNKVMSFAILEATMESSMASPYNLGYNNAQVNAMASWQSLGRVGYFGLVVAILNRGQMTWTTAEPAALFQTAPLISGDFWWCGRNFLFLSYLLKCHPGHLPMVQNYHLYLLTSAAVAK